MSIETHELAARYGAAWAAHDLDAIMAMHTDDTVNRSGKVAGFSP